MSSGLRDPFHLGALGLGLAVGWVACTQDDPGFGGGGDAAPLDTQLDGDGGAGDGGADTDTGAGGDGGSDTAGDTGGDDTGATELVGTGYDEGDTAYDLQATDQGGLPFSLHGLLGTPIVLVAGHADDAAMISTMLAMAAVDTSAATVALVGRDEFSIQADQTAAARIASTYGVQTVLTDPSNTEVNTWSERNPPKTYLIDAEMKIVWTQFGTVTDYALQNAIDAM